MPYSIVVAGGNITQNCDQMSIQINDTLGQGAGAGGTSQGRATTFEVLSNLGPVSSAVGAGNPGTGGLVRQGEIVVTDQNGNVVFGGFISKLTDTTQYTLPFAKIEAIDYSTSLQRVIVNKTYSAQSDYYIINDILKTYAPWVDRSQLSPVGAYVFPVLQLRNITLEAAIQKVARITGFQFWVDFKKVCYYQAPVLNHNAPFQLSDTPDFTGSFPHWVEEYYVDDNAIINKVTFYGGKKLSSDQWQDVSPLANGNNRIFTAAWYMRGMSSDNLIHVTVNGVEQIVGNLVSSAIDPFNHFKSQGGICNVLINSDARNITFDPGYAAPAGGAVVLIGYRYMYPLTVVVADEASHQYFGQYLEGTASDETIFDTTTAVQRCKVILLQQSFGLTSIKLHCWKPGVQAGQTITLKNVSRGLGGTFVVQEVVTTPLGGGNFDYELTLGAWNWNLVDLVMKSAIAAAPADTLDSINNPVDIKQALHRKVTPVHIITATSTPHGGNTLSADGALFSGYPQAVAGLFTMLT